MDNQLCKNIIEDLKKSGFGSEMVAIKAFSHRSWNARGSKFYFDKDEDKTREIDIHAYRLLHSSDRKTIFYFHIVGEVKKTTKHWVIFKRKMDALDEYDAWGNLTYHHNLPVEPKEFSNVLAAKGLRRQISWIGYGIHEFTKKPNDNSVWYAAAVQSCKAAIHVLAEESFAEPKKMYFPDKPTIIVFVKPVIIIDGLIFSAELTDDGDIQVEEIDMAVMDIEFQTKDYKENFYSVDIVNISCLNEYLKITEDRQDYIHNRLAAARKKAKSKPGK